MSQLSQRGAIFDNLKNLFTEIGESKRANAEGDPGRMKGETTHPSKSVDDGTLKSTEGFRSAENEKDVREQVPSNVNESGEAPDQNSLGANSVGGVKHAPTGEEPSVEDDYGAHKSDPGTSMPARTDDGVKYGQFRGWTFDKLAAFSGNLGNEILADITNGKLTGVSKSAAAAQPAMSEVEKAAAAGYEWATILGMEGFTPEQSNQVLLAQAVKEAAFQADLVADYLRKRADEGGELPPDAVEQDPGGGAPPEAGGMPPGGMPGGMPGGAPGGQGDPMEVLSQLPPEILQELVALVESGQLPGMEGGAGGEGGGMPPGAEGGMPPGMEGGGMPPGMEGGGMPPGAEGGGGALGALGGGPMPGGPPSEEEALNGLGQATSEMGVSPEELMQQGQKAAGSKGAFIVKAAAKLKAHMRSGKFRMGEPKTARAQRINEEMRDFVREVFNS